MNRYRWVRSGFTIARRNLEERFRHAVWAACFLSAFGFALVLALLPSASTEAGLTQTKPSKARTVLVQQPDAVNARRVTKKGVADQNRSPTNTIVIQPPSQPAPPLTFTLTADKTNNTNPYQGELVNFKLTPSRETKSVPFEFDFADGSKRTTEPGKFNITHRFTKAGNYSVTATPNLPGVPIDKIGLKVSVEVYVQKIPLTICGGSPTNPHAFAGQEVSLATHDLNDAAVTYQFVFDERSPGPSTRAALPATIRGGNGELMKVATFIYPSPDRKKILHAELLWTDPERGVAESDGKNLRIDPLPENSVDLTFTPLQPAVNQQITLTASPNWSLLLLQSTCPLREDNLQYRFEFADGPVRDWSSDPTASNAYSKQGKYRAVVKVRIATGGVPIEKTVEIPVVLGPVSDGRRNLTPTICVPCLIIGGVIILVCGTLLTYFVYQLIPKPPPTVRPTPSPEFSPSALPPNQPIPSQVTYVFDSGERTATDRGPQLSVNIQVRLNRQISRSETQLMLNEGRLIKFVRRHYV
jgi:hypothetical protein